MLIFKVLLETRNITLFNNKFGRLIVGLIYDLEYGYYDVLKEYSYEEGKLIRYKTLKDINPWCIAEGGNNLIAFGTHNGHVYRPFNFIKIINHLSLNKLNKIKTQ